MASRIGMEARRSKKLCEAAATVARLRVISSRDAYCSRVELAFVGLQRSREATQVKTLAALLVEIDNDTVFAAYVKTLRSSCARVKGRLVFVLAGSILHELAVRGGDFSVVSIDAGCSMPEEGDTNGRPALLPSIRREIFSGESKDACSATGTNVTSRSSSANVALLVALRLGSDGKLLAPRNTGLGGPAGL
ncbi:hypothetical protein PHYPSEUDO_013769 [Phytophthora pseudosyringae]|uniref:Uncharacterized protein n=1 Tax=Phytophthora pseudosyringae TaxID=221518 RepID=A0A8T1V899_9STRA|nr:hypothetical protein PHYPSEUDO_013769 [Phytophthora pseudosyringae]